MRHGQRGLLEQQAFLGGKRRDPTPLGTLDDGRVVGLGLEPQEREFEPALAVLAAVARPLVAAELGQEGHDLVAEADPALRLRALDRHLDAHLGRPEGDLHLGRPIRNRANPPLAIHASDRGLHRHELHLGTHIAARPVTGNAQDHQPLSRFGPEEPDLGRKNLQTRAGLVRPPRREAGPDAADDRHDEEGSNSHLGALGAGDYRFLHDC